MSDHRTVLVAGATGKQGGAVAGALLEAGHAVRAMTRNPDSPAAQALARAGATLARADFADRAALAAAMEGADTAFAMATPFEAGVEAETRQGVALIEAAEAAGIGHLIYSSVAGADRVTGVPHFDSKHKVEARLKRSALGWTIVAPAAFMDFAGPRFRDGLRAGEFRFGLPAHRAVQYVAVADIGAVVAELVARRDQAFGERIELAGDERTGAEVAATLTRATGRPIRYVEQPIEAIRAFNEDLAAMFDWLNRVGYAVDRASLRAAFPHVRWHSLNDWAAAQDWRLALDSAA